MKKPDPNAFAELALLYQRDMYRVAKSFLSNDQDAADAMQEALLAAYEKLSELRNTRYFKTWLLRILINKCNDILRAERRTIPVAAVPEREYEDTARANAEFMMLMDSLGEQYRTVLVLYYGEGWPVREIAAALGLTESAVKTRLKRGREKARRLYDDSDKDEEQEGETHGEYVPFQTDYTR